MQPWNLLEQALNPNMSSLPVPWLHFWTAERREIFPLLVACVELQAEVISGLRLVVYRLMKLFRGMHVRVVRLDDKLSLKKSDGEGIGVAEYVSWKFAALVGQFVII